MPAPGLQGSGIVVAGFLTLLFASVPESVLAQRASGTATLPRPVVWRRSRCGSSGLE